MKNIIQQFFLLILTLLTHLTALSKEPNHIKTAYSAELKSYNKYKPNRVHKSKVVMSQHGVRVESNDMFIDNKKGLYIQNFNDDKAWVVDTDSKIYSKVETEDNKEEIHSTVGGIMATRPCLGSKDYQKKITGQASKNGERVIIWNCFDHNNQIIKQGYSQKWSTVIWEQLPNGDISELTEIKKVDYNSTFFKPSEKYREVSLREFYAGAPALEVYAPNRKTSKLKKENR